MRAQDGRPSAPLHNVLVEVRLAVVGGCEGVEPGDGEGMAEHHLHVHPLGLLGPPPLLLLQLLDALRGPGGTSRVRGGFGLWFFLNAVDSQEITAYVVTE